MAGVYVHVPFCHAKCWYCDFYSMPLQPAAEQWLDATLNEWEQRREELDSPLNTLYIGGGTPSSIPTELLSRLIDTLKSPSMKEITVEVNPEDMTRELASALVEHGVNRVSMGVQSLIDCELEAVGRRHTAADAINAVATLREAGVKNISLDLIYGLPLQTVDSWQQSVEGIIALHPEHLSAYSLSYEPGTRLTTRLNCGKIRETPQEVSEAMYRYLCHRLGASGYEHYEISNFALPYRKSIHNSSYWNMTPYLGLGPSAHSYTGGTRKFNPGSLKQYLLQKGVVWQEEDETDLERFNDYVMVRLRTAEGIDLDDAAQRFGSRAKELIYNTAAPYLDSGQMQLTPGGALRISEESWIVSDGIMCEFMQV